MADQASYAGDVVAGARLVKAYILDGVRTPFGKNAGALSKVRVDDLLATSLKALVERAKIDPSDLSDVIIGCANQAGEDSRNVARNASLLAGFPVTTPGQTVNRLCGSGLNAVIAAAQAAMLQGQLLIAGGVEGMSRSPFVTGKADVAFSRKTETYDSALGARFPNKELIRMHGGESLIEGAELTAMKLGIVRAEMDQLAWASQDKYFEAQRAGFYEDELIKLPELSADEQPRASTLEELSKLKSISAFGMMTAGNSSSLNDGAAALLIGSDPLSSKPYGLEPLAEIVSWAVTGCKPIEMGTGPVSASMLALSRAGLMLDDIDIIELNEAFAAQALTCLQLMGLSFDDPRVNPHGGAIAIGHPLGASGARLALTAARTLRHRNKQHALVTMCIGMGQGIALVLKRYE